MEWEGEELGRQASRIKNNTLVQRKVLYYSLNRKALFPTSALYLFRKQAAFAKKR